MAGRPADFLGISFASFRSSEKQSKMICSLVFGCFPQLLYIGKRIRTKIPVFHIDIPLSIFIKGSVIIRSLIIFGLIPKCLDFQRELSDFWNEVFQRGKSTRVWEERADDLGDLRSGK